MTYFSSYQPVTPVDLYDFYGITALNRNKLDSNELDYITKRLADLKKLYLNALQKRFSGWCKDSPMSIREMVDVMAGSLYESIESQAKDMAAFGTGFDMLSAVQIMRGDTEDRQKAAEKRMIATFSKNLQNFRSADYPKIAKGVVDLYNAEIQSDIILAIDFLNDLQHCGGYILIDFVAGTRDPSNKFGNEICKEILDLKSEVQSPLEITDKMSEELRVIIEQQFS